MLLRGFAFCSISIATMFAHLCLQLRSSTASGSWKACVPSGTECNWRKLICSTVRLERLFVTNMQNQYVRLERLFVTNMQNQ